MLRRVMAWSTIAVLPFAASTCGLLGGLPGGECKALETGNFSAVEVQGGAEVKGKVTAFLEAAYQLDKLAVELEAGLIQSCGEIGFAIGLSAAEMQAKPDGGKGAEEVCGKVSAKIDAILKAHGDGALEISVAPPRCYANVEAMQQCLAGCDAAFEPGELEASCEGGEIAGKCDGSCSGTCSAQGGVKCNGKCNGSCNGKCDGNQSSGSCDGTCDGSCSGDCELSGEAKCSGTCSGSCDVEMKAPKCSGEYKPPKVDASCHANCSAKLASSAKCDPPTVVVEASAEAKAKGDADLDKLVQALKVKLPAVIKAQLGTGKRVLITGKSVVDAGAELPSVAGEAGLSALACIGAATDMAASASASVDVSIEASASVSGSAGAN